MKISQPLGQFDQTDILIFSKDERIWGEGIFILCHKSPLIFLIVYFLSPCIPPSVKMHLVFYYIYLAVNL